MAGIAALAGGLAWYASRPRPEEIFQRGWQALQTGDLETASRCAAQLDPWPQFKSHGQLLAGGTYIRRGHPEAALHELGNAVESPDLRLKVLTLSAEAYFQLGRFHDALKMSRLALDLEADNPDALWWAASACYKLGDVLRAAPLLLRLTKQTPGNGRAHYILGRVRKDQQEYRDAAAHYRAALQAGLPALQREAALVELAETLAALADFEGALRALAELPESADTHVFRARCENGLGRSQEALDHAQAAVRLDPGHVDALTLLGQLRLANNDAAGAISVLKQAARRRPRSSIIHYALLQAYTRLNDAPHVEAAHNAMQAARALEDEFERQKLQAFQNAEDADVRVRLGELAEKLDRPADARDWYHAALGIDPKRADAKSGLERLGNR